MRKKHASTVFIIGAAIAFVGIVFHWGGMLDPEPEVLFGLLVMIIGFSTWAWRLWQEGRR